MTLIVSRSPVLDPRSLADALKLRAAHPEAMCPWRAAPM